MTNIFAIQTPGQEPYIFCVADSQSSNPSAETKNSGAQKLVKRGNCLIMDTGRADIAYSVLRRLDGTLMSAEDTAHKILNITQEFKELDEKNSTRFLVIGKDKKGLVMYEVPVVGKERGIYIVHDPIYAQGSGASQVVPALRRDMEQGFVADITSPLEALALCFGISEKAGNNLWVNDRLQIGVVSNNATRLLMHPLVESLGDYDFNESLSSLTGVAMDYGPTISAQRKGELMAVRGLVGAFYRACEQVMHRFIRADIGCNSAHTALKSGKLPVDEYLNSVKARELAGQDAQVFVDAFLAGGTQRLDDAVKRFYLAQSAIFDAATQVK